MGSARKWALLFCFVALVSTKVSAQSGAEGLLGLFGGMMEMARLQAAQEAWSRVPQLRRYCYDRSLMRHRASVTALIQRGVMPNDPGLSHVASECMRFEPSALRTNYPCSVDDETGATIRSTCNQGFARQESGDRKQSLDVRAAIEAHFTSGNIVLSDIESEQGRKDRERRAEEQRRIAEVQSLRTQIDPYRASRSEPVRARAQGLLQRLVASPPASPVALEEARREQQILTQLARFEEERLGALEKLDQVKVTAERRIGANSPQELRDELTRLRTEYSSASKPPQPLSPEPIGPHAVVGPAFDCSRAKLAVQRVICAEPELRRLDIELLQPVYVLRHVLPARRDQVRDEGANLTRRVQEKCNLSENQKLTTNATRAAADCIRVEYRRQRDLWRAEVEREALPAARQETYRSADDHVHLHATMQEAGFRTGDERADGIYGGATRSQIINFQRAEGMPADGLMSDATAERLLRRVAAKEASSAASVSLDPSVPRRLAELQRQYLALIARADDFEGAQTRLQRLRKRVADATKSARDVAAATLPQDIRVRLLRLLSQAEEQSEGAGESTLLRIAMELEALRPSLDDALALSRATSPRNEFVVLGDLSDTIVLFNDTGKVNDDTGKAPSVIKNLRGDLIFENAKTLACFPHDGSLDSLVTREINARLAKWDQSLRFPLPRCNLRGLPSYDLVVVSRGALLKEKASDVVSVLSAIDAGVLARMFVVSADEVRTSQQQEAIQLLQIETGVEKGDKRGFGVVAFTSGGPVICGVISDDRDAHETLVRRHFSRLAEELRSAPTFVPTSGDAAFIGIKRGNCAAIYARAEEIKELVPALRRDQISFRYLPIWIEPEQVEEARKGNSDRKARELEQEADRDKRKRDDDALRRERDTKSGEAKRREQQQLQHQYGAMARAFEGVLTTELREYLEGRSQRAAMKYSALREWYETQKSDRWELMTVETALQDYGVAQFKGRSLEAGFAKTLVKMRHKVLGQYKEQYFLTGFISDTEFEMEREPISAPCDNAEAINAYSQGQRFTSHWLVR